MRYTEYQIKEAEKAKANLTESQIAYIAQDYQRDYVISDIRSQLISRKLSLSEEAIFELATKYVFDCEYDCDLSYWQNLNNLIDTKLQK